jgi:hypothetical protein
MAFPANVELVKFEQGAHPAAAVALEPWPGAAQMAFRPGDWDYDIHRLIPVVAVIPQRHSPPVRTGNDYVRLPTVNRPSNRKLAAAISEAALAMQDVHFDLPDALDGPRHVTCPCPRGRPNCLS